MTTFLWTLIALLSLEVVGKLYWLGSGDLPERTPAVIALDVIGCVALIVWAVYLLK